MRSIGDPNFVYSPWSDGRRRAASVRAREEYRMRKEIELGEKIVSLVQLLDTDKMDDKEREAMMTLILFLTRTHEVVRQHP